jgi:hypothetical protein
MQLTDDELKHLLANNPEWVDVGNLPSNFYPYSFGSIHAKPFTINELKLISKAVVTRDIAWQKRAVDSVISRDVEQLSIGDYFYLLEWLKIHSATKTPTIVTWECTAKMLKHKETGEYIFNDPESLETIPKLDPALYEIEDCGTHNTESLHVSDLRIHQLPEEDWQGLPEGYDFPRMSIYTEIAEALKDPELNMIVGAAQWIKGDTLGEKLKRLEQEKDLDMFNTAMALKEVLMHGVSEHAILHCRKCRITHPYEISVDPLDFFQ